MSFARRLLTPSALIAGLIFAVGPGCKSGGGLWSPGWAKSGASSSDLAVSRPTTRVPTPSSGATPTTAGSLASTRTAGAQDGPYGGSPGAAPSGADSYGTRPADWQGEPHSSVAPAGGYQTGGPYGMASGAAPSGVTPGAYAQPAAPGTNYAENREQPDTSAGGYGAANTYSGAEAYGDASAYAGAHDVAAAGGASVYQDPRLAGAYAPPDPAADNAPPSSSAPGAVTASAAPPLNEATYGDTQSYSGMEEEATAAAASDPAATQQVIANPYSLPTTAPSPVRPPTSPAATTSPATAAASFTPPTLPSSLSGTPGSYRPGSTASPGSLYGAGASTIYQPPTTASGTGYSTVDGTLMR